MPVVAARAYIDGKMAGDVPLDALPKAGIEAGSGTAMLWIGLEDPTADELAAVARRFGLHPLALEDAAEPVHLPKVEAFDDYLFVIARTAAFADDRITLGNMAFFVGEDFIVTVRHAPAPAVGKLRARLEARPNLLKRGPSRALHAMLDRIGDDYIAVADAVEDRVLQMEEAALDAFLSRDATIGVFRLRREIMRLSRLLGTMVDVTRHLSDTDCPQIPAAIRPYFRDILDHVRRSEYRVTALASLLEHVLDTSNLFEQQRQGVVSRQLAAWAAILAVPTMIAGLYGMNFRFMPELDWRWGYPVAVLVMGAISAGLYWRFKRLGWL